LKGSNSDKNRKVALITGASSGIGLALSWVGAQKEFNLMLTGRNQLALEQLRKEITAQYPLCYISILSGEISEEDFCKTLIRTCIERLGRLDVLINNAGMSMRGLLIDTEISVLKRLMDVNFWGSVYCTKYALPYLLEQKGSVIGVSSIAGFKGLPARTGYSSSKFALQGFLESLRNENRKTGLHVLIACPGYTESNIRKTALDAKGIAQGETPLNESKLMSANEVALSIWKAYDIRSWYVIMTAQGKLAVWINKLWPQLADWLTYKVISKEPNSPFS
jgi:short-subunit dehydrogenase